MNAPIYVDDWKTVRERWLSFWDVDMVDRPVLQISVPRKGVPSETDTKLEYEHNIPKRRHGDIAHIYNWGIYSLEHTKFIAEGLPLLHSGSSIGHALYYGCEIQYDLYSAWAKPLLRRGEELPDLILDKNGYWYRWHRDMLRFLAFQCEGRYFMLPTFGNHAGDTLALIRGVEQLMLDIIENPDWVRDNDFKIGKELTDVINDRFLDVEQSGMDGYVIAGMWSPKRPWEIHCDISSMVSTNTFQNIFWPSQKYVVDQSEGYNYYHVDGLGVLNHIDVILKEPKIPVIQWLAGAGGNNCLQDIEIFKMIQSKGKAIQVHAAHDHVIPFLKEVHPAGVCFNCECPDEDTAYKLVEDVTNLYK